ncbi:MULTISPECIES: amidohydrolase/deacetylase family metallohydrolase [Brucella/Ochrobactrum group]|uniref:Amidohydrolase/deacetylase family metallohydrolase n=1 Tax=Ochrobactrum teleogrylli TaxID=2479765 RepID=A0ABD5K384_9HYPH|nr:MULTISPECIES: amidohydrolase/deacetylase family metallohydrolase [Brucella]KAB2739893.1 amidohydrolase/deacetylase family metallohydrolase [Brucella anthropi]MCR5944323.1 amidohydrolase/deacetylase family metallohydrolase [Ochrobactrum sp. XJ1]TMU91340.1 amidohydrolase/deacetylase family metallohydrolase [Brucella haematophila]
MSYDLVLKNGRVIDPSQAIDRVTDVAFKDGRVAAVGEGLTGTKMRDVSGLIVTPGLIDLHTHVYWGGTSLGVDPDLFARKSAVSTCVDTGSAGPGNFPGFRKHVIERSTARVLVYLHISFAGIYGFAKNIMLGESHDIRLLAAREAVEVINENRDVIVGVKVRIGRHASGPAGIQPLDVALQVADETGLPLMAHIDEPPPSYEAVVSRLRKGDVLTHCFRPFPNAPIDGKGNIKPEVLAARERGVIFDIGHGMGSFAWKTARAMMGQGFMPDTISSDVHALCITGPAYDQVTTLSKFLALGMPISDVIAASTINPALAVQRPELGTLKPGAVGDASVLDLRAGTFPLEDVRGEVVTASQRLFAAGLVIGGREMDMDSQSFANAAE